MRKLDILVPHYREKSDVIKPLLDSIALQQNVDFNEISVIICHDGVDIENFHFTRCPTGASDFELPIYPFEIEQHHISHKGVSAARNAALDHSEAEYVMFADCDDMFFNACGLWVVFRDLSNNDIDTYVPSFLEEARAADTGEVIYLVHTEDCTFVHGKVHRRQYLIDKGIRWNEGLTVHEDSYFNILCQALTDKKYESPTAFYLWKWRQASVCRHDPKYMLKTYHHMIKSNDALIEEFRRRGQPDKEKFYVTLAIMDAYYTMNKPDWINQENKEYRDSTERRFAYYYRKYRAVWDGVTDKEKMIVSNRVRARNVSEGMGMESVTLSDWLSHIEGVDADGNGMG
jgi:glycosyltransferase involved in cell wall biosynthesis